MQCTQCGHINQAARFCVKCGAHLEIAATSEVTNSDYQPPIQQHAHTAAPSYTGAPAQPNEQIQQVKKISKQYLSYFLEALKSPVKTGQSSNDGHMVNGLITFILFALTLPLIMYFQLRASVRNIGFFGLESHISFGNVVIKPFFFMLIVVMLVNSVIFLVLKLGNAGVNYREVTARFGTFMIPSVASFLIALLFSLLISGSTVMGLLIGIGLFSWLVAVCFVIYSFKKDHAGGLDAFYGVIITYVASAILLGLFGNDILHTLFGGFGGSFLFRS
ncbi:zinc ribbon domain-containing protein [Cohnella silvisoli]|uniref:Zinc ribbon domain-containing protein n=1 Tax=Cohnella silvisoli TaxID=2873699 RepID=A0ABV1KLY8_9BACL|nr:zinc ribbon domain-containing protein [Cohnella silvisoli]MCD9020564.1 zinc ribbon domain-containing protein [Cohnella silvisoli]